MMILDGMPKGEAGDSTFRGLHYPDGTHMTRHMEARLLNEPFYQSDKLAAALSLVKRRDVAIDCGAWVGAWTRELARHFKYVFCIEANSDSVRCIRKNLEGISNVGIINAAVGESSGTVSFVHDPTCVGSYAAKDGDKKVQMLALDEIIDDNLRTNLHIDYLKVHVNGMELKALRGAARTIRMHKPVITVVLKKAIEDFGDTAESARQFLKKELRYECVGGERPYEIWSAK